MLRKVVIVPPDPFRGMRAQRNSAVTNSQATPQGLDQRLKKKTVSYVVWEDVGVPVRIAGIVVGKNKGNKR